MDRIKNKIKNVSSLSKILNIKRNQSKIAMCHGVFDIVHPGHIRHLVYTKSHADILIASLTADRHITKGNVSPYIPEHLRAYNLAMLECVDYVIIDYNSSPISNLSKLKPNYFAKGYEYINLENPKTVEEKKILDSYGGEFIFTPTDVVYSSSQIIEKKAPNLSYEKLNSFMKNEKITFSKLNEIILYNKRKPKILVVGDIIIDSYVETELIGGQVKTPTISVKKKKEYSEIGGAGIVCKHLKKAGADVDFLSVLGTGKLRNLIKKEMKSNKINFHYYDDRKRPVTEKKSIICKDYSLLKIDTVENLSIDNDAVKYFISKIKKLKYECIIFSDFRHGIFNNQTISKLTAAIPKNIFKVADSQVASRWGNILEFKGFDMITPNENEARFALNDQDSVIRPLAYKLYILSKAKFLILKLGDKGLITYRNKNPNNLRAFFYIDSFVERLNDAVGAGDSLLAYSVISYLKSKNIVVSSIIGAIAAAVHCENKMNKPIEINQIASKFDKIKNIIEYENK